MGLWSDSLLELGTIYVFFNLGFLCLFYPYQLLNILFALLLFTSLVFDMKFFVNTHPLFAINDRASNFLFTDIVP